MGVATGERISILLFSPGKSVPGPVHWMSSEKDNPPTQRYGRIRIFYEEKGEKWWNLRVPWGQDSCLRKAVLHMAGRDQAGKGQIPDLPHFKPQFCNLIHFDMPITNVSLTSWTFYEVFICIYYLYMGLPTPNLSKILWGPWNCRKSFRNVWFLWQDCT